MQKPIRRNAGLEEAQAVIKIAGRFTCIPHPRKVISLQLIKISEKMKIARRISITSDMQRTPPLW